VIEGLRVAPAYFDARNGPNKPFAPNGKDCEECRATVDAVTRQQLGCAYEPALDRPDAVWSPPAWRDRDLRASTCPGYTTSLPAVLEAFDAYPQWEQGTLTEYLDGEPPTSVALSALMQLRAGIKEHEAQAFKPKAKGGGS
jgi:hypothetical protein